MATSLPEDQQANIVHRNQPRRLAMPSEATQGIYFPTPSTSTTEVIVPMNGGARVGH